MENELKKPKYKVGQQVRVRSDLTEELWQQIKDGSGFSWHNGISHSVGKVIEITYVYPVDRQFFQPAYKDSNGGQWCEDALYPLWTTLAELNTALLNGEVSIEDYNRYREELK